MFSLFKFRIAKDIFKVSYSICKSRNLMFALKSNIENIKLLRVILVTTDGFHYPIDTAIKVEKGEIFIQYSMLSIIFIFFFLYIK